MAIVYTQAQQEAIATAELILEGGTVTSQQVIAALEQTHWNVEQTINRIMEGWQPVDPAPGPLPAASTQQDPWASVQPPSYANATVDPNWTTARDPNRGTGEQGWGEAPPVPSGSQWSGDDTEWGTTEQTPAQRSTSGPTGFEVDDTQWGGGSSSTQAPAVVTPHREPMPLPSSPAPVYKPTILDEPGATPSAPPTSPIAAPVGGRATLKQTGANQTEPIDLTGADDVALPPTASGSGAAGGWSDSDMEKAIALSLQPGNPGQAGKGGQAAAAAGAGVNGAASEDEAMNRALEESLAMSQSMTLEADKGFAHPSPSARQRQTSHGYPNPVQVRTDNAHLAFLPCVLIALYAAKPFRDRILSLPLDRTAPLVPIPRLASWQPTHDEASAGMSVHEVVAKRLGDFNAYWMGDGNEIFAKEEKDDEQGHQATPMEHILALQRLFALMTHTTRSYIDAAELSSLLGYSEGNNIDWPTSSPSRGFDRTWNVLAEMFRSGAFQALSHAVAHGEMSELEAREEWAPVAGCMHWRGDVVDTDRVAAEVEDEEGKEGMDEGTVPMTTPDPTFAAMVGGKPDNSTSCMTLHPGDHRSSSDNPSSIAGANDVYSCIDARTWHAGQHKAHLLENAADVIAFALERNDSSTGQFRVDKEIWVDRYLMQKRRRVVRLRREAAELQEKGAEAFKRKAALQTQQGVNVVATMKATCAYLERAKHPTDQERAAKQEDLLRKYRAALERLEAEVKALDEVYKNSYEASRAVFDVDDLKEFGPYELVSAIVHDGFAGRDHLWTYVRRDEDERWFKLWGTQSEEVSIEAVLNDTAGLHTGGGHVLLVYSRKQPNAPPSSAVPAPDALLAGVQQDNVVFASELSNEAVSVTPAEQASGAVNGSTSTVPSGPPAPTEDVQMRPASSPRSDVADTDIGDLIETQVSLDESMRLRGGAAEVNGDGQEDDDGEEDDEVDESYVELGFLKKIKKRLDPLSMTGKVGGSPIWINPELPLPTKETTCSSCGDPMSFLLQMNAPDDTNADAYLRAIYVFTCRRLSCLQLHGPGALKAFRIQLPEQNPYYGEGVEPALAAEHHGPTNDPASVVKRFREWEIICDEEPEEDAPIPSALPANVETTSNGAADPDAKDSKDSKSAVDPSFIQFQARLARAPNQMLRYLRASEPPAEPLWASARDRPTSLTIPPCPLCRAARTAEFQVMPTILSSIGIDSADPDSLDFGAVVVYTCSRSCTIPLRPASKDIKAAPLSGWAPEACFIQFFSSEGVDFAAGRQR